MSSILHARAVKRNQVDFSLGTTLGIIYKSKVSGIEKQAQLTYSPFKNVFYAYFTEDDVDFEVKVDNSKVLDRNVMVEIHFQNEKSQPQGFGYVTKKEEGTYLKSITTYGKNLHFSSNSTTQRFGRLAIGAHYSNKLAQHFNISIQTNGKILDVPVSQYNTIYQIKEIIMKMEGIEIARQQLISEVVNGKKSYFSNGVMLGEANIGDGNILYLEVKDATGKNRKKSANKKTNESKKETNGVNHGSDGLGNFNIGNRPRIQPSEALLQFEPLASKDNFQIFRPDKNFTAEYYEIELKFTDKVK